VANQHLKERLDRAAEAMGTYAETFVSGDPPVNQALEGVREAIGEARKVLSIRDRQDEVWRERARDRATKDG
jgi:hypothetical protein